MNKKLEFFKKFIVDCADIYIEEHEVNEQEIFVIDNFADCMLTRLEELL